MRSCLAPQSRAAVERLLRETALTVDEISARSGVKRATIYSWNARSGWLRPRRWRRDLALHWSGPRRAALERLLSEPRNDPGDVAEAAGLERAAACRLLSACGVARSDEAPSRVRAVLDPPTLRAHLRAHIARQIAAFDAALSGEGAALDSARVLRDLGGLKRLLDEIGPASGPDRGPDDGRDALEGGDGGTEPDMPALRAEIARRYAGFVRGREAARLPGDPAGSADPGGGG